MAIVVNLFALVIWNAVNVLANAQPEMEKI